MPEELTSRKTPIELSAEKFARTRASLLVICEQWRGLVSNGGQVVKPVGGACCGNGLALEKSRQYRQQVLQQQRG
jgi:hypothetical protein